MGLSELYNDPRAAGFSRPTREELLWYSQHDFGWFYACPDDTPLIPRRPPVTEWETVWPEVPEVPWD